MPTRLQIIILVFSLLCPINAFANYSCSFSLGMHRATHLNKHYADEGPTIIWGTWEASIGYHFPDNRYGILLSLNYLTNKVKYRLPGGRANFPVFSKTSLKLLGNVTLLGRPQTLHVNLEAGPTINLQQINNESVGHRDAQGNSLSDFRRKTNLGGILGINFIAPTRFANVFLRLRYTYTRDYYSYNTSGIGASIGIGFGNI